MTSIINFNNNDQEPLLSDNSSNSSDSSYCVICLEDFSKKSAYNFDCGHHLHVECFHKYFFYNYDIEKNYISCPICRTELNVEILPIKQSKCTVFCKYFLLLFCISSIGLSFIPYQDLFDKN